MSGYDNLTEYQLWNMSWTAANFTSHQPTLLCQLYAVVAAQYFGWHLDNQEHTRETTKTSLHLFIVDHEDEAHTGDEFGEDRGW